MSYSELPLDQGRNRLGLSDIVTSPGQLVSRCLRFREMDWRDFASKEPIKLNGRTSAYKSATCSFRNSFDIFDEMRRLYFLWSRGEVAMHIYVIQERKADSSKEPASLVIPVPLVGIDYVRSNDLHDNTGNAGDSSGTTCRMGSQAHC